MAELLSHLLEQLQDIGATKVSWAVELEDANGHRRWVCTIQAANEMGAPVELPAELVAELEQTIHAKWVSVHAAGVWSMDVLTGRITPLQPRPGDGAGAPGIAERMP